MAELPVDLIVRDLLPAGVEKGREWHTLCPFHDDRHLGNFSVSLESGAFFCFSCGAKGGLVDLVAQVKGLSRDEARAWLRQTYGKIRVLPRRKKKKDKTTEQLEEIWQACDPEAPLVRQYLRNRGLSGKIPPNIRQGWKTIKGRRWPAMVARVEDVEGRLVSLHFTYLIEGKKAPIKNPRRFATGTRPFDSGGAVKFGSQDSSELHLCEGVEDALSILETLGKDKAVWACLSAVGLEKVELPPNASPIFVWADNDPAGIRAAKKLAQRLAEQGAYGVTLRMPKGIKDVNELLQIEGPEGIRRHYEEALREISSLHLGNVLQNCSKKRGRPSKSDQLLQLLENEEILLFHDQYRQPWARIQINDHYENLPLENSLFRDFLAHLLWRKTGETISQDILKNAIAVLSARARFEGPQLPLFYRTARHGEAIWIDLGSEDYSVVEVSAEGWKVCPAPKTPLFKRHTHMEPLPKPSRGPGLASLREVLPLREADWAVFLPWLAAVFIPDIPRPGLVLHGPPGTGKTTFALIIRLLVDPSTVPLLSLPSNVEGLVQVLDHHFLPVFDNLRTLSVWASDTLCMSVTGAGFSKRRLFTDDEDIILRFTRSFVLTGIAIPASSPDLLDRSILLEVQRIEDRLSCQEILSQIEKLRPYIFAELLDALSAALAAGPQLAKEIRLPRMADFAAYAAAAADALGIGREVFLQAYHQNIIQRHQEIAETDPVSSVLMAVLSENFGFIEMTPSELFALCNQYREREGIRDGGWPKTVHHFSYRIRSLLPILNDLGIEFEEKRTSKKRLIKLRIAENSPQKGKVDHEPHKQREFLI